MKSVTGIRLLVTVMAAILLGGCEKDSENTIDSGPIAASITSNIIRQSTADTRASGTVWAANDCIGVSAASAAGAGSTTSYTNIQYTATGFSGDFTVVNAAGEDNNIYFQDQKPVDFTAYYPYHGANGTQPGSSGILSRTLTAADQTDALPRIDYLWSSVTGITSAQPEVKFSFRHCMSRLKLNFLAGKGIASLDDITYTLAGLVHEGTFNTLTGEAKATGTASPTGLTLTVPSVTPEMSSTLLLFPQQSDAWMKITLTLRGVSYDADFQFPENKENNRVRELASGYSYIYNVTLNNETMTISPATIGEWGDGGSQDVSSTN